MARTLLFAARSANQQSLYTYNLEELPKEPPVARQLTSTPGRKSNYIFAPDGKDVFYLENGTVKTIVVESRTPKTIAVSAPMQIDFDVEKKVVFEEAWETLNRRFYDANFNGKDWLKLHDEWAPYIAGVKTSDELRRDINLLIGELNSSHSGINRPMGPGNGPPQPVQVGNLGLRFDREAYEAGKGLVVREVIALGPAAIEGSIKPGDRLVSVNGEAVGAKNLDGMLEDTVGKRVVIGVETAGKTRDAVVRPVSSVAAVGLLYRQWVDERRALVDRLSGGKTRLRSSCRYERCFAAAALYRSRCAERGEERRCGGCAEQQWRLHQRICAGRVHATELPDDDAARIVSGAFAAERLGSGHWVCRRCW